MSLYCVCRLPKDGVGYLSVASARNGFTCHVLKFLNPLTVVNLGTVADAAVKCSLKIDAKVGPSY